MVDDASSAAGIPQPLMSYTRSMIDPSSDWKLIGDYAIWSGNRRVPEEPYVLHELFDSRVLPVPVSTARAILHAIKGGTWFHVQHLFGFWMRADVDTVWVDAPGNDGHYYTLILGGSKGLPGTLSSAWVCPSCGTLLHQHSVEITKRRFEAFLNSTAAQVALFNGDNDRRVCPACNARHPASYGFLNSEPRAAANA